MMLTRGPSHPGRRLLMRYALATYQAWGRSECPEAEGTMRMGKMVAVATGCWDSAVAKGLGSVRSTASRLRGRSEMEVEGLECLLLRGEWIEDGCPAAAVASGIEVRESRSSSCVPTAPIADGAMWAGTSAFEAVAAGGVAVA